MSTCYNPYQDTGGGYATTGYSAHSQESARISPVTGKPMRKVQIRGSGKVVTIDVDETGGVFLDPAELAELAVIEGVAYLLKAELSHAAAASQQRTSGTQGFGSNRQP